MNPVYTFFLYFVWFFATYYTVYFFLSLFLFRDRIFEDKKMKLNNNPKVSILVPAYNEEKSIADTIASLKKVTYRNIEIIVLSDGSKDETAKRAIEAIDDNKKFVVIDNRLNKGKAATLNQGIALAKGEFVATMDADSIIEPGIIEKVLPYFEDKKVGAVTVSVSVRKPKNLLHKIFAVEFAIGLSLFLKLFSFFDSIFVTPGPFSVYRKSTLEKIGGYDPKNITEDHEIAFRLHKNGFKIKNCIEAKVYTTLPDTFKKLYIQRRRWYSGSIQTLFQHRDMLFKKKYKFFGFYMPFHYFLIILGLSVFLTTIFLEVKKFVENVMYYRYTNYNFFDHLKWDFDLLYYSRVNVLAWTLLIATIAFMIIGIIMTRNRFKDYNVGLIGFPFIFFLYQVYWIGAIIAVVKNKKISWR